MLVAYAPTTVIRPTRPHLSWPANAALGFFPYPKLVMARECGPPRGHGALLATHFAPQTSLTMLYARLGSPHSRAMTFFFCAEKRNEATARSQCVTSPIIPMCQV